MYENTPNKELSIIFFIGSSIFTRVFFSNKASLLIIGISTKQIKIQLNSFIYLK